MEIISNLDRRRNVFLQYPVSHPRTVCSLQARSTFDPSHGGTLFIKCVRMTVHNKQDNTTGLTDRSETLGLLPQGAALGDPHRARSRET